METNKDMQLLENVILPQLLRDLSELKEESRYCDYDNHQYYLGKIAQCKELIEYIKSFLPK
jgi:hypothetical protein